MHQKIQKMSSTLTQAPTYKNYQGSLHFCLTFDVQDTLRALAKDECYYSIFLVPNGVYIVATLLNYLQAL